MTKLIFKFKLIKKYFTVNSNLDQAQACEFKLKTYFVFLYGIKVFIRF